MEFKKEIFSIYPNSQIKYQQDRYQKIAVQFEKAFGKQPCYIYSAPGRSEICGNHTDHNLGKAVGASINLDIIAFVAKRDDNKICIKAAGFDDIFVDLADIQKKANETGQSTALIRGICAGMTSRGYKTGGFNAYTANDVLKGSGLSSSAAFEMIFAYIINDLYNDCSIDPKTMAIISQYAENEYFGKASGLLDQLSCGFGGMISIDFEDAKNPNVKQLPFDFDKTGYKMIITDTRCDHADLTDDYVAIKGEMQSVAAFFGKEFLRQVDFEQFRNNIPKLREQVSERAIIRAFHFFDENKNVSALQKALSRDDFDEFLKIVNKSGNSSFRYLQNIYSDKKPTSQGVSLALCMTENILEKGAWRVHGGGFGGTIQAYVHSDKVCEYIKQMELVFGADCCYVLSIRQCGPVRLV